jgi:hypothetical protein
MEESKDSDIECAGDEGVESDSSEEAKTTKKAAK